MKKSLSVVIQAGGKSNRMGQDKALMPFLGSTLIEYVFDQVKGMTDDLLIITNNAANFPELNIPLYPDVVSNIGALGGVYSALHYAKNDWVLILACDMPFVNPDLLTFLLSLADDYDVVVPQVSSKGYVEPFRAAYRRVPCLSAVKDAIERGDRRVVSFFEDVNVRRVSLDEFKNYDQDGMNFINVNTPEELQMAEEKAKNR